jgi:hypothetical protein
VKAASANKWKIIIIRLSGVKGNCQGCLYVAVLVCGSILGEGDEKKERKKEIKWALFHK